jgi:hypothetical protein
VNIVVQAFAWLAQLRAAMARVEQVRATGPDTSSV